MKVFRLTPTELNDPAWHNTTNNDVTDVHAPDEAAARLFVGQRSTFTNSVTDLWSVTDDPWQQQELVKCTLLKEHPYKHYAEGAIIRWNDGCAIMEVQVERKR